MENERKVITPEQFLEYKKMTNFDNNIWAIYIVIVQMNSGFSLEQIAKKNGMELNDFLKEIYEVYPNMDFNTITEEQLLSTIPQIYRNEFTSIRKIVAQGASFEELDNSPEFEIFDNNIESLRVKQEDMIADALSNSDLSQIPANMWNDVDWIKKMHFENTGANIDMRNWSYSAGYDGSFVGCNLISFDNFKYARGDSSKYYPDDGDLEPKQYQAFLDAYRGITYLPTSIIYKWIENDSTILDNNIWIIDSAMNYSNNNNSVYALYDLWSVLNDEQKNRYSAIFDTAFNKIKDDQSNSFDVGYFCSMLGKAPVQIWDKYIDKFEKMFVDSAGNFRTKDFIENIWIYTSNEVREKYFEFAYSKIEKSYNKEKLLGYLLKGVKIPLEKQEQYFDFGDKKITGAKDQLDYFVMVFNSLNLPTDLQEKYFDIIYDKIDQLDNNDVNLLYKDKNDYLIKLFDNLDESVFIDKLNLLANKYISSNRRDELTKILPRICHDVVDIKLEKFNAVVEMAKKYDLKDFEDYITGEGFIKDINGLDEEKRVEVLQQNMSQFLYSLRKKHNCNFDNVDTSKDSEYKLEYAKVLLNLDNNGNTLDSESVNVIIENIPRLGVDLINRVYLSNSKMLSNYANQLIPKIATLSKQDASKVIDEAEHLFSQKNLPEFIKIYKYYELINDKKFNNLSNRVRNSVGGMSPVLENAPGANTIKRVIFSDLMKIAMDSNNKSMRDFLSTLSDGNEVYIKFVQNRGDLSKLSKDEVQKLDMYTKTLYVLYENSGFATNDKNDGGKVFMSGDLSKDVSSIALKYANTINVGNLPDLVLKTYIGPYQELFGGITTVKQMQEYMDAKLVESDRYHREIAKKTPELKSGDMVKGIGNHIRVLHSIFSDGIRAGEFLGVDSHSDSTPLDTDFAMIMTDDGTLSEKISSSMARTYGSMYIVLKNNPEKVEFTRGDEVAENSSADKMANIASGEELRRRINVRSNGEYDSKKLEAFRTLGGEHYGVRTGLGITDVDYIVVKDWDKRIGYELAMNGTYVPVFDFKTQEILFTPEMYDDIREKMQGLSHYDAGEFKVDSSAYSEQTEGIIQELFPDGNVKMSVSQKDAQTKRSAIEKATREVLADEFNLKLIDRLTGNLTTGFVEFIDTGSTGRGTNLPGDGDFDFTMKVDKELIEDKERYAQFQDALRKKLGVKSDDPESSLEEANGNFRYKKVKIETIDDPLDIDITFMPKNDEIEYSTDMSVRDRLEELKNSNPEGYKATIANIVLAKRMLKEAGIYKKSSSPGATIFGGFGGVGVENWILQNGGSFKKAMETFLEAAEEHPQFADFQEVYPIFDFGQNHMAREYSHDSFIRGVTPAGFGEMQTKFREFKEQFKPVKKQGLTLEEVGKCAIETFKQNPGEEIAIGNAIENGITQLREGELGQGK